MSTKNTEGALSGSAATNWRRRLPSICSSVTSSASPRPSDSTTLGVSAPGRWILASTRRNRAYRGRDEDRGDLAVIGEHHGAGGKQGDHHRGQQDVLRPRCAALGRDRIPIER